MGRGFVFSEALQRTPLEQWTPWEGPHSKGKHKGINVKNVPPLIFDLCSDGETIDPHVYVLSQNTLSLNDLMDILEMKSVHNSWQAASMKNVEDGRKAEIMPVHDIDDKVIDSEEEEES